MSLPTTTNLGLYAGDDFSQQLTFTDADSNPIDLTGATLSAQWRPHTRSEASESFTIVVDDEANGVVTISLTDTVTTDMTSGVWDLQMTDAGGLITTLVKGMVTVYPQVTL